MTDNTCSKCHGLGYYDEGHECDDGSMAGGNYVECEKCKTPAKECCDVPHPVDMDFAEEGRPQ